MEKVIEIFKAITNINIITCIPLYDGISNDNFLINDTYVLRIKSSIPDPFYNQVFEQTIEKLLSNKNITVETIKIDEHGNKLSKYINNARYFDKNNSNDIHLIAKKIKQLHLLDADVGEFDMFKRLEFYKSQVKTLLDENIEDCIISNLKQFDFNPICLCHNDLVSGNILFKDNVAYLIDFEYASKNDIYFDLASFISENNIEDEKTINEFLTAYFSDIELCNMEKCLAYCRFLDVLWHYWALYHYKISKRTIFKEIAEMKINSLEKNARQTNSK